jgi:DNA repair photolyase
MCEHLFVRWNNLAIGDDDAARLPGYRDPATVRRFDAPEALDMRFYEIYARSAINRVPNASKMPFRWTINPYRGCSHACVYCLGGETPVLLGDGSHKPISTLRVGDEIYGTERRGHLRRYVRTRVLAHWSTDKPAYRVVLEDGAELIVSADHRFLSEGGWKHVTGSEQGRDRRPHLTIGSSLLGAGRFDARKLAIDGMVVSSGAGTAVAAIEPLGTTMRLYDITTGTGDFIANGVVSHNCFARPTHTYLDFDAGRDFEREIVVKVNVPEVVRAELRRPSWKGEHVAMGTNTDPYQWVESRYRLMPGIWEAFRDARNPCSILTKSPLLLRDLDLLKQIAQVTDVHANLSIPTLDAKAWRATEPHTPHPRARLEAVAELNRAGIPTGVLIAPLMPGINDAPEQIAALLEAAAEAGASGIGGIALHLRGEVRELFFGWLRAQRPDLVERYEQLYARGAYAPLYERRRLAGLISRAGTPPPSRFRATGRRTSESTARPPPEQQTTLF